MKQKKTGSKRHNHIQEKGEIAEERMEEKQVN